MHFLRRCSTTPSFLLLRAPAGHAETQEGSLQWKQAVDKDSRKERGSCPLVKKETLRIKRPGSTSFSSWHATSHEWQPMHLVTSKRMRGSMECLSPSLSSAGSRSR